MSSQYMHDFNSVSGLNPCLKCTYAFIKLYFEDVSDLDISSFRVKLPELDRPKRIVLNYSTRGPVFYIVNMGEFMNSPSTVTCNTLDELRDLLYDLTPDTNIKG